MTPQDLLIPKRGAPTGPAIGSETPLLTKAPKSPGAFTSAMRQALSRARGERSTNETGAATIASRDRVAERSLRETRSNVASTSLGQPVETSVSQTQRPSNVAPDPTLAAAIAAEAKGDTAEGSNEMGSGDPDSSEESSAAGNAEMGAAIQVNNIIPFPDPSVIIPFPVAIAAGDGFCLSAESQPGSGSSPSEGSASSNEAAGENIVPLPTNPSPSAAGSEGAKPARDDEDGIDILKLGLRPNRREERAENIEAVNFKQATSASNKTPESASPIVSVSFPTAQSSGEVLAPSEATDTRTQLPGEAVDPEDSAQATVAGVSDSKTSLSNGNSAKAPSSTALASPDLAPIAQTEPAGIPAARQEGRMNTLLDARHEGSLRRSEDAGRSDGAFDGFHHGFDPSSHESDGSSDFSSRTPNAMEWQPGRPISSIDRSAPEFSARQLDPSGMVDRITNLVISEAAIVRQYKSDAMAVVLRPDADTELFVHFSQRNGQIEATIRCERGDANQLGALWSQLQESLGHQKVRLAPLQESPANQSSFNSPSGSQTGNGSNGSPRQSPDRQSMDEWSAPADSAADSRDARGRGASGHSRLTTSRPGWETWA